MEPPRKKAKLVPKSCVTVTGRFLLEWISKYNGVIVESRSKNDEYAHCAVCRKDIKVLASGAYDVNQHIETPTHKRNVKGSKMEPTLSSFVKPQKSSTVLKAEVMMSNFIVQHNLPIADHLSYLLPKLCADSEVAKNISCKTNPL